jgi:hypothetical protein
MSGSGTRKKAAIAAVAKHCSATWDACDNSADHWLSIAGKRIAVAVETVEHRPADRINLPQPRLRQDKVARRVVAHLQTALGQSVPDGTTAMVTITAPIRLPGKTAQAVEDLIRACLARRSSHAQDTIHDNQIRIRLVASNASQAPKVIGLIHNPDTDPGPLLDTAQTLLEHIGAAAGTHKPARSATERWLVLVVEDGFWPIETYRQIHAQLSMRTDFSKILMVFAQDRVEALTG